MGEKIYLPAELIEKLKDGYVSRIRIGDEWFDAHDIESPEEFVMTHAVEIITKGAYVIHISGKGSK